eukprot:sb/3472672/
MSLSDKLSYKDIDYAGKRVFIRVDFNVPLKDGQITNLQRINAALPTINFILGQSPKCVVLASHLGRPNGKRDAKYSLAPVAEALRTLLAPREVLFLDECVGVKDQVDNSPAGSLILLENLRYRAHVLPRLILVLSSVVNSSIWTTETMILLQVPPRRGGIVY